MASESANRRRQPNRLQRRAPASIQINRSMEWNTAIPLLSPVSSPPSTFDQGAQNLQGYGGGSEQQKPAGMYKKWQAAPFCYDPNPYASSYSRYDGSRR